MQFIFFLIADVIQRSVLIEGVLFRARYLGSTQLVCEGQPTKTTRMMQAEEAVSRIKVMHAPYFNPFYRLLHAGIQHAHLIGFATLTLDDCNLNL